ncbi:MAG TPA: TfoX/Sxy family protein [Kofleriaceae bacterium]|jgi:TfoX/Sxy family transcriptional regulator of competence genes
MAWVKIPKEHHPLFRAALPKDDRVDTIAMFGGVAARVNGYMFAGLFGNSAMVRLSPEDLQKAAKIGAEPFDPMGNRKALTDRVLLPRSVMTRPAVLRGWLARALEFTATLPPVTGSRRAKKPAQKRATKR